MYKTPKFLVIDLFCGFGGTTLGYERTNGIAKVIAYGIIDIRMRMLMVPELLKIQGIPEDYKMVGNQTDAKKFIGNSVVPHVVKAWTEKLDKVI